MKYSHERKDKTLFKTIFLIIISIILFIVQLYLLYLVLFKSSEIKWLYIFVVIIGVVCVIYLFDMKMTSSYKLIWTILILLLPFTGTLLFLFYGNKRSFPKKKSKKIKNILNCYFLNDNNKIQELKEIDDVLYKHIMIINSGSKLDYYKDTKVEFFSDIYLKHQKMLEDMKNAKRYIFMEFFIINSGKLLESIIDVLYLKAQEGIEIKICFDDVGSKLKLKKNEFKKLLQFDNIQISKFGEIGLGIDVSLNCRNHRKCVIIDGIISYNGGDNISDEYANFTNRFGHWRDNAVRLEGKAVKNQLIDFCESWYISTNEALDLSKYQNEIEVTTNNIVMPFFDGPTDNLNPASDLYISIANNAKRYLYISTPYLIIDNEFLEHISHAAKSGVDVRLLIPGIPDKKLVYIITESNFGKLLEAGVKIYKYSKGFNHAKNYICDDLYAVVGSINLDYRSLYLHFENGTYIYNDQEIIKMKDNFIKDLDDSEEITLTKWKKRKWYKKILEFILKMFSPLM